MDWRVALQPTPLLSMSPKVHRAPSPQSPLLPWTSAAALLLVAHRHWLCCNKEADLRARFRWQILKRGDGRRYFGVKLTILPGHPRASAMKIARFRPTSPSHPESEELLRSARRHPTIPVQGLPELYLPDSRSTSSSCDVHKSVATSPCRAHFRSREKLQRLKLTRTMSMQSSFSCQVYFIRMSHRPSSPLHRPGCPNPSGSRFTADRPCNFHATDPSNELTLPLTSLQHRASENLSLWPLEAVTTRRKPIMSGSPKWEMDDLLNFTLDRIVVDLWRGNGRRSMYARQFHAAIYPFHVQLSSAILTANCEVI